MKLMFVDETGDEKHKEYLGICVAMIDSKSYPLLKRESLAILEDAGWDPDTEFKGRFLFSATTGTTEVEVDRRVEAAGRLLDLNASTKNGRLRFAYGRMSSTDKAADYLEGVPALLSVKKVLPKPQTRGGKNLISVTCDDRDDVYPDDLHKAVAPVLEGRGYVVLERVQQATSTPQSIGLMYADLVAYLVGRVETISSDAGLFEGLDHEVLEASGKYKKLTSSTALIKRIKNLDLFVAT
jgi:hypothetical protein